LRKRSTMCDERERLIEYVYGESTANERQQVEAHLGGCHVCRAEVSGLRGVRDDLLAWDVPRHEPIWRPAAPAPVASSRVAWPAWALGAAAGAVFTAGLAGGLAARGWMPDRSPVDSAVVASAAPTPQAPLQPVSTVTAADLARLEAAILERVRGEMREQMRAARVPNRSGDIETRVVMIERLLDDQISLNNIFNSKFGSLNSRTSSLSEQFELSRLQRVGFEGSVR
jgi:hypothetical protein